MHVQVEDPATPDISALLTEHLDDMYATTPAESVHALDIGALQGPSITFVAARTDAGELMGVGAVKSHPDGTAELKSMRTCHEFRGQGVARAVVDDLVTRARLAGHRRVALETGVEDYFTPARTLYQRMGFAPTGPFADYVEDPLSVFYVLDLSV